MLCKWVCPYGQHNSEIGQNPWRHVVRRNPLQPVRLQKHHFSLYRRCSVTVQQKSWQPIWFHSQGQSLLLERLPQPCRCSYLSGHENSWAGWCLAARPRSRSKKILSLPKLNRPIPSDKIECYGVFTTLVVVSPGAEQYWSHQCRLQLAQANRYFIFNPIRNIVPNLGGGGQCLL